MTLEVILFSTPSISVTFLNSPPVDPFLAVPRSTKSVFIALCNACNYNIDYDYNTYVLDKRLLSSRGAESFTMLRDTTAPWKSFKFFGGSQSI